MRERQGKTRVNLNISPELRQELAVLRSQGFATVTLTTVVEAALQGAVFQFSAALARKYPGGVPEANK